MRTIKRKTATVAKTCETCGNDFNALRYIVEKGDGRFCSRKCANKARKPPSTETREKLRNVMKNRVFTVEWKQKISNTRKGKPMTEQQKTNLSKGWNKHRIKCKNETKEKISKKLTGHKVTTETRIKLHETHLREKSPNWQGGISFEPYCPKFNENLKTRVRLFFDNECIVCGIKEINCNGKLCVHHVEYNKQACCDGMPVQFAALCRSCHGKTGKEKDRWETILHRVIDEMYNGKSYYTKEEWKHKQQSRTDEN
jgi:hypothetical protein